MLDEHRVPVGESECLPEVRDWLLPDWAVGTTDGAVTPGAQLCTRDGRRIGNAVVRGPQVEKNGRLYWPILTDAGTDLLLTEREVDERFWPPCWVMEIEAAPGFLALRHSEKEPE